MLDSWLDLIHGGGCVGCPTPGRPLCRQCASRLPMNSRPVRPTPCPDGLAPCFAAGEYADLLRAMILAHKEHGVFALAAPLGRVLAAAMAPVIGTAPAVLVPVPSRPAVVRARGHDPMLRITRAAARALRHEGADVGVHRLLEVRAVVQDQAGLDAAGRAANLSGSLATRARVRARLARTGTPVTVVVCDDVLTTGATAREAQRALEDAGITASAIATVAATRKRLPAPSGSPRAALSLWGHRD